MRPLSPFMVEALLAVERGRYAHIKQRSLDAIKARNLACDHRYTWKTILTDTGWAWLSGYRQGAAR